MQQVELFCEGLSWKPSASLPCLTNLSFNEKNLQSRVKGLKLINAKSLTFRGMLPLSSTSFQSEGRFHRQCDSGWSGLAV